MSADLRLREFEGNMEKALRSFKNGGGVQRKEPGIAEVPFDQLLRTEARDRAVLNKIEELYARWQEMVCRADALDQNPRAKDSEREAARKIADEFHRSHEDEFAMLSDLDGEDVVDEYDWRQRMTGVKLAFRWILAEGFHPLKIMKRVYAIGRALGIDPFTQLTMEEQGLMFSETKAAVSWRLKQLSGVIAMRCMAGKRLPGQKSPHSAASYSGAQQGNGNRAAGAQRRARQGSFLRSLHVEKTNPKP